MTDPHWQQTVDEFRSLPENERSCARVLEKLHERGVHINSQRVSRILAATVAEDLVSGDDIRATAKVLKLMVDLCDLRHGRECCRSSELFDDFASNIASTLAAHPDVGGHQRSIRKSLAALAAMYSGLQEIDSYLASLESERRWKELGTDDELDFDFLG